MTLLLGEGKGEGESCSPLRVITARHDNGPSLSKMWPAKTSAVFSHDESSRAWL